MDLSELIIEETSWPNLCKSMSLQRFHERLHDRRLATYWKVERNLVSIVSYGVLLFLCRFVLQHLLCWVLRRIHLGRLEQARNAGGEIVELDRGLMGRPLVPLPPSATRCGLATQMLINL